jgi:hypothetical protein
VHFFNASLELAALADAVTDVIYFPLEAYGGIFIADLRNYAFWRLALVRGK